MDNKTILITLMALLLALILVITVTAIIFVTVLKKRKPVVKVVIPPQDASATATELIPDFQSVAQSGIESSKTSQQSIGSMNAWDLALGAPNTWQLALDEAHVISHPEEVKDDFPKTVDGYTIEERTEDREVDEVEIPDKIEDVEAEEVELKMPKDRMALKYDYTFEGKLIQSDDDVKDRYNEIKNHFFSYAKVKSLKAKAHEKFRIGRETVAQFRLRGKTLCLYLAVDPAKYVDTKYGVKDASEVASLAATPAMMRLTSSRRVLQAKQLIDAMMEERGVAHVEHAREDFRVAYKSSEELAKRGLAKLVKVKVREFKSFEPKTAKTAISATSKTKAKKAPMREAAATGAPSEE
ncbi:MAG: hypothetical protein HDT28_05625 [Clostridiales bacterium]|nr:hypothetical protein [Clostridiales bacterium]